MSVTAPRTGWHTLDPDAVADALSVGEGGLSIATARQRLAADGPNELEEARPPGIWLVFGRQFLSPLIFVLVVAAVVTALLDEWIDTWVITAVLLVNAAIGFTQERKAEASVRALQSLVSPQARVSAMATSTTSRAGNWSAATSSCWRAAFAYPPMSA
jgi:P-type Ca2+ transporter type 2C